MLYPDRAFVTRPLVVWRPGASASFLPHLTPPVSRGQGPHHRPEHLAPYKRPNPSAALCTSHEQLWEPTLVTQRPDGLGMVGAEPCPQHGAQSPATANSPGSCLVPVQLAPTCLLSHSRATWGGFKKPLRPGPILRHWDGTSGTGVGQRDLLGAPRVVLTCSQWEN